MAVNLCAAACMTLGDGCMLCELYLDVCVNCSCSVNYSRPDACFVVLNFICNYI